MEQNYTIPINEAFEASRDRPACGCPLCALYRRLEENELDLVFEHFTQKNSVENFDAYFASAPTKKDSAGCTTT